MKRIYIREIENDEFIKKLLKSKKYKSCLSKYNKSVDLIKQEALEGTFLFDVLINKVNKIFRGQVREISENILEQTYGVSKNKGKNKYVFLGFESDYDCYEDYRYEDEEEEDD